jgi:GAF domain-containing protein
VLYLLDGDKKVLFAAAGEGLGELFDVKARPPIGLGEGMVGQAVDSGKRFILDPPDTNDKPLAILPLLAGEQKVGVLVFERFLTQKSAWSAVDFELFTLLSAHAGTAILAAMAGAETEGAYPSQERIRSLLTEAE